MKKAFDDSSIQLKQFDERLRDSVEKNPVFFITIALAMLIVIFFWNIVKLLLGGLFFAAIALLVIAAAFFVQLKALYRKRSVKDLKRKKSRLLDAIDIAKQRYMHRKLSEQDFNQIFKEEQRELIEVEALLAQALNPKLKRIDKQLSSVQAKTKHVLKSLLEEKRLVLKEMDIAERSYLARKLNQTTYKELLQKKQKRLIELESELKNLFKEEKQAILERKRRIAREQKAKKGRKYAKMEQRTMTKEIFDQGLEE